MVHKHEPTCLNRAYTLLNRGVLRQISVETLVSRPECAARQKPADESGDHEHSYGNRPLPPADEGETGNESYHAPARERQKDADEVDPCDCPEKQTSGKP